MPNKSTATTRTSSKLKTSLQSYARVLVAMASSGHNYSSVMSLAPISILGHAVHLPPRSNTTVLGFMALQQTFPFDCGNVNETRTSEGDGN